MKLTWPLDKGRKGLPVGTKRQYGGMWWIKTADGKWAYAGQGDQPGQKKYERKKPEKKELGDILDQEPKQITEKVEPTKDDKKIAEIIQTVTPETRNAAQAELFGFDPEGKTKLDEIQEGPYEFTPEESSVILIDETLHGILDYRSVVPRKISLSTQKGILDKPRPTWLPELTDDRFARHGYRVCCAKLGPEEYLLLTKGIPKQGEVNYAVVSLDVLIATQDYYQKRAKEKYRIYQEGEIARIKEEAREKIEQIDEIKERGGPSHAYPEEERLVRWESYYRNILSGKQKIKLGKKPVRIMGDNKMTWDQYYLIQKIAGNDRQAVWNHFRDLMPDIKQKASDMQIQYEDLTNVHAKGEETSYGDKGTKSKLLNSHGVLVKRQNGDEITGQQIAEVRNALDSVYSIFGNRSEMARGWNLKISHAGDKAMHARKACGIFFPHFHAIGVSAGGMGFTLAHEWAHFMDYYLGGKNGWHYACDNYGSLSGQIAKSFRDNMRKRQSSDYQNRTKECFARALEQYYATKVGEKFERFGGDNYVDTEVFNQRLLPLIDRWFAENDPVLKSAQNELRLVMKVNKSWDNEEDDDDEEEDKDAATIQEEAVEKEQKNEAERDKNRKAKVCKSKLIMKAKPFPEGTVRVHGGRKMKKVAGGWIPVSEGKTELDGKLKPSKPKKSKKPKKGETVEGSREMLNALQQVATKKGVYLDDIKGEMKKTYNTLTKLGLIKFEHKGVDEYKAVLTESGQKALDGVEALRVKMKREKKSSTK